MTEYGDYLDPSEGVLTAGDLLELAPEDAVRWHGYQVDRTTWTWNDAERWDDGEEPNDFGTRVYTFSTTLDACLDSMKGVRWHDWYVEETGTVQSKEKKDRKGRVSEEIVTIGRMDGKKLSSEERRFIAKRLKLRTRP